MKNITVINVQNNEMLEKILETVDFETTVATNIKEGLEDVLNLVSDDTEDTEDNYLFDNDITGLELEYLECKEKIATLELALVKSTKRTDNYSYDVKGLDLTSYHKIQNLKDYSINLLEEIILLAGVKESNDQ